MVPGPRTSKQPPPSSRPEFWYGMGLGLIPVVIGWVALGLRVKTNGGVTAAGDLITAALLGWVVVFLASIVYLSIKRVRFLGYGLLSMAFVGPVVWCIGC